MQRKNEILGSLIKYCNFDFDFISLNFSPKPTWMNADRNKNLYLDNGNLNLSQLFHEFSQPLFYYALKFVDQEVAKDVVQDVFFKLWENKNLKITSSLSGLLFSMARNKCLQHLEKEKVRSRYQESVVSRMHEDEILFYSSGSSSLIERELQTQLEQAIEGLPEKCREVFVMSRFQDKMNKEIAAELGISIKMVEKHISKALKIIRVQLKDYLPLLALLPSCFFSSVK
jgi:RNA polymerase sigma-70 factor (ECF subfamily)